MISNGQLLLGSSLFDLTNLDEAQFVAAAASTGATKAYQRNGYAIYRVERVFTFGRDCTVGFEFSDGQLRTVTLYLVGALGEAWRGREWEMAALEEDASLHAEWLGQLVGDNGPVRNCKFDWGEVWVTLDPKGWNTGITIATRR